MLLLTLPLTFASCRFGKQAAGGGTKVTEGEGGDTMGEGMLDAGTEEVGITMAAVEVAAGMDTGTEEATTGSLEGALTPPPAHHVCVDTNILCISSRDSCRVYE